MILQGSYYVLMCDLVGGRLLPGDCAMGRLEPSLCGLVGTPCPSSLLGGTGVSRDPEEIAIVYSPLFPHLPDEMDSTKASDTVMDL